MSANTTTAGRSLGITLAVDFGIQLVFYIYSAARQTETLYDLSGSLTYIVCVLVALLLRDNGDVNAISSLHPRQIVAAALVLIWALRLGSFLFMRVQKHADRRFDTLKTNPVQFAIPWSLQVIWIFLTAFPVFAILGNISTAQNAFGASDGIGIAIWVFGFVVEAVADAQKSAFKTKNPTKFMQTGLFKYSRYPNYFGEVTLWVGMFILCANGFTDSWQWVTIISPIFVFCLIYFLSGVAMLEKSSEARYGQDPEFIAYKARTSKFILWFPKSQ
ncbi:hypothetical protein HDU77_005547 [Chytriomyces hyalinus]|uniref:Uncharacterized protein n=1 Tax=Chytriomyces confervae TaxID=246404 RepID=A0A507FMQ9_9FUNG|nr:hypothetical protein HDU77_005547 [Chytriomyces hyalinus]KAJ3405833.1 hypothetical protein HDU80_000737 [Chytriomyces hyalinus]TPX77711.1 hypothetical protein CcCBS67573_g01021 [Chytriomyces confervae]